MKKSFMIIFCILSVCIYLYYSLSTVEKTNNYFMKAEDFNESVDTLIYSSSVGKAMNASNAFQGCWVSDNGEELTFSKDGTFVEKQRSKCVYTGTFSCLDDEKVSFFYSSVAQSKVCRYTIIDDKLTLLNTSTGYESNYCRDIKKQEEEEKVERIKELENIVDTYYNTLVNCKTDKQREAVIKSYIEMLEEWEQQLESIPRKPKYRSYIMNIKDKLKYLKLSAEGIF